MNVPSANWSYPTAIRFGAGRIAEIGAACAQAGIKRPLLVTDRGLARMAITARTLDLLEQAGLGRAVFAEVDPNPNELNLAAGLAAYRAGGHDGVVAFGGGSGLDLAKMVAFMSGQTRPIWDFEDIGDWWTRADPAGIAQAVDLGMCDRVIVLHTFVVATADYFSIHHQNGADGDPFFGKSGLGFVNSGL